MDRWQAAHLEIETDTIKLTQIFILFPKIFVDFRALADIISDTNSAVYSDFKTSKNILHTVNIAAHSLFNIIVLDISISQCFCNGFFHHFRIVKVWSSSRLFKLKRTSKIRIRYQYSYSYQRSSTSL